MKRRAIVVDLDGTAANISHRNPYDTSKCQLDPPNEDVKWFVNLVLDHQVNIDIIFCSGRKEKARKGTGIFLYQFTNQRFGELERCKYLFMRDDRDNRPDDVLKEEIYLNKIAPFWDVSLVIDDRDKVVSMWRLQGLNCWQCRPGNF